MTSPAIAATTPLHRHITPAAAANKERFLQSLQIKHRLTSLLARLKGLAHNRYVATVTGWVSKGFSVLKGAARRMDVRWGLAAALTTETGQSLFKRLVIRPVSKVLGFAAGLIYGLVRAPFTWFKAERFIDVPVVWTISKVRKAAGYIAPKVAWIVRPDGYVMAPVQAVSLIGLAKALGGFSLLGPVSFLVPLAAWSLAVFTTASVATALVLRIPAFSDAIERVVFKVEDWANGVHHDGENLEFAAMEVTIAEQHFAEHPESEKARKELIRAQRIHEDLLKRKARQEEIDAQMALLDKIGLKEYAIAIRQKDPRVKIFTEVMSRNQAYKILREHGEPTAFQAKKSEPAA